MTNEEAADVLLGPTQEKRLLMVLDKVREAIVAGRLIDMSVDSWADVYHEFMGWRGPTYRKVSFTFKDK